MKYFIPPPLSPPIKSPPEPPSLLVFPPPDLDPAENLPTILSPSRPPADVALTTAK